MEGVKTGKQKYGKYLEAKKKARRAAYQTKCKAERKRLENIMLWWRDQKCNVFRIAKRMVKTNQTGRY